MLLLLLLLLLFDGDVGEVGDIFDDELDGDELDREVDEEGDKLNALLGDVGLAILKSLSLGITILREDRGLPATLLLLFFKLRELDNEFDGDFNKAGRLGLKRAKRNRK